MTLQSFQIDAYLSSSAVSGDVQLAPYVDELTIRMDVDRVEWVTATLDLVGVPADVRALLDPTTSGTEIPSIAPVVSGVAALGGLWEAYPGLHYADNGGGTWPLSIRSRPADLGEDQISVQLGSFETVMQDKRNLSGATVNTNAANVRALVQWLLDTPSTGIGGTIMDRMNAGAALIPAGDRRLMQPGEQLWELIEAELNAAGGRLFTTAGTFVLAARTDPPRDLSITRLTLSTHPDADGILVRAVGEDDSRDDDWADAVICKFDYTSSAGTRVTSYQTAGASPHSRALQYTFDRAPSPGIAQQILNRSLIRGRTYEITCQLDFRVRPGVNLTLTRPSTGPVDIGMCRSVEYRVRAGEMTVRTQVGAPVDQLAGTGGSVSAPATDQEVLA